MLPRRPSPPPARPRHRIVTGRACSGEGPRSFFALPGLTFTLIRPSRKDEEPGPSQNWLRQRVEAIIWHAEEPARSNGATAALVPPGCGHASSSVCAPDAAIWFNWQIAHRSSGP